MIATSSKDRKEPISITARSALLDRASPLIGVRGKGVWMPDGIRQGHRLGALKRDFCLVAGPQCAKCRASFCSTPPGKMLAAHLRNAQQPPGWPSGLWARRGVERWSEDGQGIGGLLVHLGSKSDLVV